MPRLAIRLILAASFASALAFLIAPIVRAQGDGGVAIGRPVILVKLR